MPKDKIYIAPNLSEIEEQRRSFAYGNTAFENPDITRELIDEIADALAQASKNST